MLNTFKIVMETVTHSFKINLSLKERVLFEIEICLMLYFLYICLFLQFNGSLLNKVICFFQDKFYELQHFEYKVDWEEHIQNPPIFHILCCSLIVKCYFMNTIHKL